MIFNDTSAILKRPGRLYLGRRLGAWFVYLSIANMGGDLGDVALWNGGLDLLYGKMVLTVQITCATSNKNENK